MAEGEEDDKRWKDRQTIGATIFTGHRYSQWVRLFREKVQLEPFPCVPTEIIVAEFKPKFPNCFTVRIQTSASCCGFFIQFLPVYCLARGGRTRFPRLVPYLVKHESHISTAATRDARREDDRCNGRLSEYVYNFAPLQTQL